MYLLDSISPVADIAQQAGLVGVLALGVWLFWREIKEQNKKIDSLRTNYDEKYDKMFERLVELEMKNIQSQERHTQVVEDLTDAIEKLKNKLQ